MTATRMTRGDLTLIHDATQPYAVLNLSNDDTPNRPIALSLDDLEWLRHTAIPAIIDPLNKTTAKGAIR